MMSVFCLLFLEEMIRAVFYGHLMFSIWHANRRASSLEDGSLVDRAAGEEIPAGVSPMPETSEAEVCALKTMSSNDLRACCV